MVTSLGSSIRSAGGDCVLRSIQAGASGAILRYVNQTIEAWMMRRSKRFMGRKAKTGRVLERLSRERPGFLHNARPAYAARSPDGSPVTGESHAGIHESPAVRFRRPTRQAVCPDV